MRLIDADSIRYTVAQGDDLSYGLFVSKADVAKLPTVQTRAVRFAYLRKSRDYQNLDVCSVCGCGYPSNRSPFVYTNYCSKCGARFIEGEADE